MQERLSTPDKEHSETPSHATYLKRKKGNKLILLVSLILLILVSVIYLFFFKKPTQDKSVAPTPTPVQDSEELPTPTPTIEELDKSRIKIQILNGTGIAKEAVFLQEKLEALGYSAITLANAQEQNYETTEMSFSASVPQAVQEEIESELKDIYQKVSQKTSSSQSADIIIITGLRAGQSLPTLTPTAKPTPTPTRTGSLTPTPTATATATPSPTPTP